MRRPCSQHPVTVHAGNAKLPAGEYRLDVLDDSGLTLMEISSADGFTSALFRAPETDVKPTPDKSELIFNKYGDRYFFAELFEAGSSAGSQVVELRYEKAVSQEAMEAKQHVTAHRMQQGN